MACWLTYRAEAAHPLRLDVDSRAENARAGCTGAGFPANTHWEGG